MINHWVVFTILLAASSSAEFQRVLGGPGLDRGVHVSPTRDGGYIITGVTANGEHGGEDVQLMKLDAAGEPVWNVSHGGAETDNGWSVHETADGYIVGGCTDSFGAGGFDFYLLATDAQGALLWSRTYGGEADDRCWAVLPTADGGYLLVGETWSSGAGEEDFLAIKTDADGRELWSRTYGGTAGDRCFAVAPTADGGFLLVGQTYSEGAGERDAHVVRIDADGNRQWSRTFGGAARDVAHSVCATSDGNFLLTGYTASFTESGMDPYLIKLGADGDSLWTRSLPVPGICRAITGDEATDGGFFLTGFRHDPATGTGAALLLRTDAEGRMEWSREFLPTSGQSFGYTVRATADGGCVFTGHTTEGSAGDLDALVVKVR